MDTQPRLLPYPATGDQEGWARWWEVFRAEYRAAGASADGIDPAPEISPPNPHDLAREQWAGLRAEHPRLLRGEGPEPWRMPTPLSGEDLRELVATLLAPTHRLLLRELFLDLIGQDIVAIAAAAAEEARRA